MCPASTAVADEGEEGTGEVTAGVSVVEVVTTHTVDAVVDGKLFSSPCICYLF